VHTTRYKSATEDELLRAFKVLDTEKQNFITEEQLSKYLMEEAEKYTPEEFEEMMSAAKDIEKGVVRAPYFFAQLVLPFS
jgi:Ca2+-binding EF-hand superfamily protein